MIVEQDHAFAGEINVQSYQSFALAWLNYTYKEDNHLKLLGNHGLVDRVLYLLSSEQYMPMHAKLAIGLGHFLRGACGVLAVMQQPMWFASLVAIITQGKQEAASQEVLLAGLCCLLQEASVVRALVTCEQVRILWRCLSSETHRTLRVHMADALRLLSQHASSRAMLAQLEVAQLMAAIVNAHNLCEQEALLQLWLNLFRDTEVFHLIRQQKHWCQGLQACCQCLSVEDLLMVSLRLSDEPEAAVLILGCEKWLQRLAACRQSAPEVVLLCWQQLWRHQPSQVLQQVVEPHFLWLFKQFQQGQQQVAEFLLACVQSQVLYRKVLHAPGVLEALFFSLENEDVLISSQAAEITLRLLVDVECLTTLMASAKWRAELFRHMQTHPVFSRHQLKCLFAFLRSKHDEQLVKKIVQREHWLVVILQALQSPFYDKRFYAFYCLNALIQFPQGAQALLKVNCLPVLFGLIGEQKSRQVTVGFESECAMRTLLHLVNHVEGVDCQVATCASWASILLAALGHRHEAVRLQAAQCLVRIVVNRYPEGIEMLPVMRWPEVIAQLKTMSVLMVMNTRCTYDFYLSLMQDQLLRYQQEKVIAKLSR